jgi:hypothetical protein
MLDHSATRVFACCAARSPTLASATGPAWDDTLCVAVTSFRQDQQRDTRQYFCLGIE